jgi:uncharacterized protein YkwD
MELTMPRTMATGLAILMTMLTACAPLRGQARGGPAAPPRTPSAPGPAASGEETATDPVAVALLEAHNRKRAEADLPPLALNAKLTAAAVVHARDMAEHQKMAHEGSDDSKPSDRIERQGYHGRGTGENVAFGQRTVEKVMTAWMNSPHHRENILGDFSEMGAARAEDKEGAPYWCVTFGLSWPRLDPARAAAALVEETNRRRAEAELPPLKVAPTLADAAQHHARAMAEHGKLVRKDDEGQTPFDRVLKAGGRFRGLGQAMVAGQPDVPGVLKVLMDNKDLKTDALGHYSHVGVGYAQARDEVPYWCILYGRAAGR